MVRNEERGVLNQKCIPNAPKIGAYRKTGYVASFGSGRDMEAHMGAHCTKQSKALSLAGLQ